MILERDIYYKGDLGVRCRLLDGCSVIQYWRAVCIEKWLGH